jgi:hypothetical protein
MTISHAQAILQHTQDQDTHIKLSTIGQQKLLIRLFPQIKRYNKAWTMMKMFRSQPINVATHKSSGFMGKHTIKRGVWQVFPKIGTQNVNFHFSFVNQITTTIRHMVGKNSNHFIIIIYNIISEAICRVKRVRVT